LSIQDSNPIISIILPTYNEDHSISELVSRILRQKLPPFEILVINDGSSDNTAQVAEHAGARVISHPYNIGNGAAIKTGIRNSNGKVLVMLDGDGQHNPDDIPRLVEKLGKYHMAVGARSYSGQASNGRALANYIYNTLATIITNFQVLDLTSGFRAIRRVDALRFCELLPNTFSYPTTITLAFLRSGRSVCYVPIHVTKREGKSKIRPLKDGSRFLLIILKLTTSFSPLRIFIPLSIVLLLLGITRYCYTWYLTKTFTNMSHLMMTSSLLIFVLGLISEQIAALRLEGSDPEISSEHEEIYAKILGSADHPGQ
jgi:glycosyltransferase involved in cell wall biosynthesis